MKNYYTTLGVDKGASLEDIKKAYKKLALKYHPDAQQGSADTQASEQKFKEISEAYAVLSDSQKRKNYDMFGSDTAGFRKNYSQEDIFSSTDFSQIFSEMDIKDMSHIFSHIFDGSGFSQNTFHQKPPKAQNVIYPLEISFKEAFNGCKKTITYSLPPAPQTSLKVTIPAGIRNGAKLKIAGKGMTARNRRSSIHHTTRGDLLVQITVSEHPQWRRKEDDIYMTQVLSLSQALLGDRINISTLDGSKQVTVLAGTSHGKKLRLKGLGFPKVKSSIRGDLYVECHIEIPKSLSAKQFSLIKELKETGL
ncbi:MAG: DnaJ domain-containing protein [Proteobacteria bacterium]|nr:DnaJ domain-containing protein [Pseudomonadota bacterium]